MENKPWFLNRCDSGRGVCYLNQIPEDRKVFTIMTLRSFARRFSFCAVTSAALTGAAHAAAQNETFRDWTASMTEVDTGEDLRKTCTAATSAADKSWTLGIAISNGDALPPDGYPTLVIDAAGGGLTEGEDLPAVFSFGDKRIEAKVHGGGKQVIVNNTNTTSLALLQAMAAGSTLDVTLAGKTGPSLSLSGFTASYRKLGAWCGFPTSDVTK